MSTEEKAVVKAEPLSVAKAVGARYSMEAEALLTVLSNSVFPKHKDNSPATKSELTAFLAICHETGMNPFTREIFAYVAKDGSIQTIISVDGWLRKINEHPAFEGIEFTEENDEKGNPISITAVAYRSDRKYHTPIKERYKECYRNTDPWNQMPHRMMRNKVIRQVARFTFGFASAVVDEDYLDEVHVGSGLSESLQKATESKAEALKEKIGAKKLKAVEPAPKPAEPVQTPAASISEPGPEAPLETSTQDNNGEKATEPEAEVNATGSAGEKDPEALITKTDRENLVAIFMSKKTSKDKIVEAVRGKLSEMGYKRTDDLKNKDLPGFVRWIESWTPPADLEAL